MSSTYHMDLRVVVCKPGGEQEDSEHQENIFILLEQLAESNVTSDSGGLVPSWIVAAVGGHWQVMREVVNRAAECEGGMFKFRGRYISPEGYIKRWRTAIEEANTKAVVGLNVPQDVSLYAGVCVPDDEVATLQETAKYYPQLQEILSRQPRTQKIRWSERQARIYPLDITKYSDVEELARAASQLHVSLSQHFTVHGPSKRRYRY